VGASTPFLILEAGRALFFCWGNQPSSTMDWIETTRWLLQDVASVPLVWLRYDHAPMWGDNQSLDHGT
jgi:hypothetical protein